MPYTRKPRRNTRKRKTTSWYDKKYSAKDIAMKALKNTQYLKGLVNSEMFHRDYTEAGTNITNTGYIRHITALTEGSGPYDRTGNSVLLRSLYKRIRITKHPSPLTTVVRMIFFIDTQQISDTTPAVADVLTNVGVDSPLTLNNYGRFKILLSKTITLTTNSPIFHSEKFDKMYHHIRFNGTVNTDIQKGGVYMLLLSDQPAAYPVLDSHIRIGYRDN